MNGGEISRRISRFKPGVSGEFCKLRACKLRSSTVGGPIWNGVVHQIDLGFGFAKIGISLHALASLLSDSLKHIYLANPTQCFLFCGAGIVPYLLSNVCGFAWNYSLKLLKIFCRNKREKYLPLNTTKDSAWDDITQNGDHKWEPSVRA
ncbi:hypothetical protein B0J17DRAFT_632201 [Rhizoctonia solani]|nr:hypothetical protein B0J17DRAFT_632201 [Rhizoctonia solani]